jgi:hypothetical protein
MVQMARQNNTCANKLLFWFKRRSLKHNSGKLKWCGIESYFPFKYPVKIDERVEMLAYSPRYYTNTTIQKNKIALFASLTSYSIHTAS